MDSAAINSPTLFNMSTVVSGGVAQSPTIPNTPTVPAATYIVNGNIPLNSTTAGIISSYDWNVSMSSVKTSAAPTILAAFQGDMLLCLNGTQPNSPGSFTGAPHSSPYTYFAININASKGSIGQILWSNTIQPPAGNITVYYAGADPVTKVFVKSYKESRTGLDTA